MSGIWTCLSEIGTKQPLKLEQADIFLKNACHSKFSQPFWLCWSTWDCHCFLFALVQLSCTCACTLQWWSWETRQGSAWDKVRPTVSNPYFLLTGRMKSSSMPLPMPDTTNNWNLHQNRQTGGEEGRWITSHSNSREKVVHSKWVKFKTNGLIVDFQYL